MKRIDFRKFLPYLGVGGTGAAAYVAIASILSQVGVVLWLAGAISYAVLTPIMYIGHYRFSFGTDASHRSAFPRYLALQALGFTMAWYLPLLFGGLMPAPIIFTLVSAIVAAMNFFLMKFWTFAVSKSDLPK
jgi:putative flippase GtrA